MAYKVLQPEGAIDVDSEVTSVDNPTQAQTQNRGYKIITPESKPFGTDAAIAFNKVTGKIGQGVGMAMKPFGDAVLGFMNLPYVLGLKQEPVTRENFLPQAGVEGLLKDANNLVRIPKTFSSQGLDDVTITPEGKLHVNPEALTSDEGNPLLPDWLIHAIARGAHEFITPENVGVGAVLPGLGPTVAKVAGIGFGSQALSQVPQQIQNKDYEGAALSSIGGTLALAGSAAGHGGEAKKVGNEAEVAKPGEEQVKTPADNATAAQPGYKIIRSQAELEAEEAGGDMHQDMFSGMPIGDYDMYKGLMDQIGEAVKGKQFDKVFGLQTQTEAIKNRNPIKAGAVPKSPAETAADLRPAVKLANGEVLTGEVGETHDAMLERNGIDPKTIPHTDPRRGFSSIQYPNSFIDRTTAEQVSGIKGTAKAGGLDSQDLPGAQKDPNAIRELRTDSVHETQPSDNIQPVEGEIRRGTGAQGAARPEEEVSQEGLKEFQKAKGTTGEYWMASNHEMIDAEGDHFDGAGKILAEEGYEPHPGDEERIKQMKDLGYTRVVEMKDRFYIGMNASKSQINALMKQAIEKGKALYSNDGKILYSPPGFDEGSGLFKFHSGIPIPGLGSVKDAAELAQKAFQGFQHTRWNKEQMARLLDAAYNRASTPEELTKFKKEWIGQLSQLKMPDGKELVLPRSKGKAPAGYENRNFMGVKIAVNEDVANIFDSLTDDSAVRRNPIGKGILRVEAEIKHKLLLFDSFHAIRVGAKTFFQTGQIPKYAYKALLETTPQEMLEAYDRGEVSKEDIEFYKENRPKADKLLRGGLNVKVWSDRLDTYHALEKPLNLGTKIDFNPFSYARMFNSWVFDKVSRSAIIQVGINELDRITDQHPEWSEQQQIAHAVRQTNIYLGNLGRQGVLKSQTMRDMAQIAFLAPQWVESMAQSEARAVKQAGDLAIGAAQGKLNVGTQLKGVGTGIAAMFVLNQVINMASTGHPTWENKEKGHKFDAFIPSWDKKSNGFWLSPFSLSAETTQEYLRYTRKGEGLMSATGKIMQNKFSPLLRAEETARLGRDYAGRRLDDRERVVDTLKALAPTPLPLSSALSDTPGQTERQVLSSIGLKVEPKGRFEDLEGTTFNERLKAIREYREGRGQLDPQSKVRAVEESVFRQQERAKVVTRQLSRADRNFLESRNMYVPGFASNIRVGHDSVPMTDDEVDTFTKNVSAGAKTIIDKLRTSEGFNSKSPSVQQEIFSGYMRTMISQERNKIRQSMGHSDESNAQNLGNTNRKFKVLQPE